MSTSAIRAILLTTAFALSGCGGGGGLAPVGSTPPPTTPPPTPPPPPPPPSPSPSGAPAIIPAATTSQQFAVAGASNQPLFLDATEQLQVRYVASSNSYEVQVPHSQDWLAIHYSSTPSPGLIDYSGGAFLWLRDQGYQYSRLMEWSGGDYGGHEAIGIATAAGGVPIAGSASYSGHILGYTSEVHSPDDVFIDGSIAMNFNFGAGTLSGSISPVLYRDVAPFPLGDISFRDTVYSSGSTTFSGKFDTNVPGLNSFSGQFTGPAAQELIGNFAFPYRSPVDGQNYQSEGAFIAR